MGLIILNKLLMILLFLSILNVGKEFGSFLWNMFGKDNPERFILSSRGVFILGVSISYILLSIFNGITL
tara:strand:- start:17167 stop:17373 length:207 start_codon:yes stop_codon:yes gene_type:complete